ncbi:hypothetical protein KSB_46740 [Ktedonobacter robiniae]|uniref:Transposase n=1 Tax=Ktedonobacter robiniae TaxID=2778365 RepID=A0ABQ3UU27_9CHLR|nr:hypothetical protein KSB_46740 [Ktedonobacter robiniae]
MARTYPWKVSDAPWERVKPLIPARPAHPKGGRPAADDRQMFSAMVYDRFRWWEEQGFFQRLWQAGLTEYDELAGIGWGSQSADGSIVKAPLAQAAVGPAPTDMPPFRDMVFCSQKKPQI